MAPSKDVEELKTLFATPARPLSPPRESALPLTRIAKFSVADENSRLAAQGRLEKEERMRQRERDEQARLSKALQSQSEVHATRERAKLHQDLTKEKNQNLVRSIRATEAEWQVEREQAFEGFRAEARKRVLIANALDARLDAQEEAVDEQERKEGTAMRQEMLRQVEETREKKLLENRENAISMRTSTERAVAEATAAAMLAKKKQADNKRRDAEELKVEKEHNREVQLTRAAVGKQAALSIRDQRQKNHDEMVREKKQFVTRDKKERAIDYTVSEEKSKLLQQKRESVEKKYRSQFAAQAEAEKWDTAPLRRYFG